jgi:hypothetical protein
VTGDPPPRPSPTAVVATARTLGLDALTVEVLRAFRTAGCRSVLLKGQSFRRHLYADGAPRSYGDVDLLVAPTDLARAGEVLASLGFAKGLDHSHHPGLVEPHAQEWGRPGGPRVVDLHWRIAGVGAPAERSWEVLSACTELMPVAGEPAESLRAEGVALLVALHAASHGPTVEKVVRDLERAVERLDLETWTAAARLAAELDATEAFASGLRVVPTGDSLANELNLPGVRSPQRVLLDGGSPAGSHGLLRIVQPAPLRERLRALRYALIPPPIYMRATSSLAARGRVGLVLAYLARAGLRTLQLPAAIRAVRGSRAASRP